MLRIIKTSTNQQSFKAFRLQNFKVCSQRKRKKTEWDGEKTSSSCLCQVKINCRLSNFRQTSSVNSKFTLFSASSSRVISCKITKIKVKLKTIFSRTNSWFSNMFLCLRIWRFVGKLCLFWMLFVFQNDPHFFSSWKECWIHRPSPSRD